MAEAAIGLAASIATLIEAVNRVKKFTNSYRNASTELAVLNRELNGFQVINKRVEEACKDIPERYVLGLITSGSSYTCTVYI